LLKKITAALYCEAVNAFGAAAPFFYNARSAATELPVLGWWSGNGIHLIKIETG
jgi:hypothetical protein